MSSEKRVDGAPGAPSEECAQLARICTQRAATYGFLSRLYRTEVDQAFLDELVGMRFPVSTGNDSVDAGYRALATYLSGVWSGTLTELAVDYCRTFVGTKADAFSAAFPLESVYTSEKRLRMQQAHDEMLAIYRANGLDKNVLWKDSEDHLATELEFMQILCERAASALEGGDEEAAARVFSTQRNVMYDHLLAWVPLMVGDMKTFAKTGFYQGLALVTMGFLESDYEFLNDVLIEDGDAANEEACPAVREMRGE